MNSSLARTLRSNPTDAEKRMWRLLFPFRSQGFHFRKQAPIGSYVADFLCHHAKLVIEVDGGQHYTLAGQRHDERRSAFLAGEGYIILRFSNLDVLNNPGGVSAVLANALDRLEPSPRAVRKT
ncbi:endonuclease domain-containing protein [Pelagibacterium sediminicola]|uniref:endonuclease domain-containing protein n=1 Tax=Pelagibacterium sediminicola TaxID=2248761 RepID=UPI000E318C2B|nr:endonuclease domain-containing protein [Pelagibacterium sediminicola]